MDKEGTIVEEAAEPDQDKIGEDVAELVRYACEADANRLLMLVLTMNSTVRHFKAANKLLL